MTDVLWQVLQMTWFWILTKTHWGHSLEIWDSIVSDCNSVWNQWFGFVSKLSAWVMPSVRGGLGDKSRRLVHMATSKKTLSLSMVRFSKSSRPCWWQIRHYLWSWRLRHHTCHLKLGGWPVTSLIPNIYCAIKAGKRSWKFDSKDETGLQGRPWNDRCHVRTSKSTNSLSLSFVSESRWVAQLQKVKSHALKPRSSNTNDM